MSLAQQLLLLCLVGHKEKETDMFLILAIALLLVWGVGSLAFHAVGAMIHLLLALALVSVVVHFVRGGGRGARI
jgi:Family of unknown function (DUF5670)